MVLVSLAAFSFTLLSEGSVTLSGLGTLSRVLGLVAAGAAGLTIATRGRIRHPTRSLVLMIAFVYWTTTSSVWTVAPESAAALRWTYVQGLGLAFILWNFVVTPDQRRVVLEAYLAGSTVLVATLFRNRYLGLTEADSGYTRFEAFGTDMNTSGLLLATTIPIVWYLASTSTSRWYRAALYLYVPVLASAVLLTGSRGASLAMVPALLSQVLVARSTGARRSTLTLAALAVATVVAASLIVPPSSLARQATIPGEIRSGTLHHRLTLWTAGLSAFTSHPVAGIGLGSYPDQVYPATGLREPAHNVFISVLVEQGLVGIVLFGALLASLAFDCTRLPPSQRWALGAMLATWTVGGLSLGIGHEKTTWFLFGLLASQRSTLPVKLPGSTA